MNVSKMRIVKWISWNISKDKIQNEEIHLKIKVTLLMKRWKEVNWDY